MEVAMYKFHLAWAFPSLRRTWQYNVNVENISIKAYGLYSNAEFSQTVVENPIKTAAQTPQRPFFIFSPTKPITKMLITVGIMLIKSSQRSP